MSEPEAISRPRRLQVVVAEDSPTEAACLEFLLSKNGYVVVSAQDGEEALRAVRDGRPDLLISDVVMPKMNGYNLCRAVRAYPATADVPVMLLTGLVEPATVLRGLVAGTDDFLLKPYDEIALLHRIRMLLSPARRDSAPAPTRDVLVDFQGEEYVIGVRAQRGLQVLLRDCEEAGGRHELLAEVARCMRRAT